MLNREYIKQTPKLAMYVFFYQHSWINFQKKKKIKFI